VYMNKCVYIRNVGILAVTALLALGCSSEQEKKQPEKQKESNKAVALVVNDQPKTVESPNAQDSTATPKKSILKARSVLGAKSDSAVVGAVTFSQTDNGVRIIADVGGLKPGKHGFHIHEHGNCSSSDASSAGGHYNPTNKKHGGPDSEERHLGDLGNLDANGSGFAHYDRIDSNLSLNGDMSIIGKSIVIHADEDDLKTDPAGNSGKRIACGVIIAAD